MTFAYLSPEEAIQRSGLRMVVVGNVPSAWGEAAKGILHIKKIDWAAVRLVYDNEALRSWAGQLSGPVAVYDDEPPQSGWAEILALAERIAPTPALLPVDPTERARALKLAGKFCEPGGLGWTRRLQMVDEGMRKVGGFPERVANYLGKKYGYDPAHGPSYGARVRELLGELSAVLQAQRKLGKPYYLGDSLSAVDVYSATFMAFFNPLPEEVCKMHPASRAAFESLDADTQAALGSGLLEHRDMMYAKHLELPLSL